MVCVFGTVLLALSSSRCLPIFSLEMDRHALSTSHKEDTNFRTSSSPINKSNVATGHSYFANVSPNDYATTFNFGIPQSRASQRCTLYFSFPRHDQLSTSNYEYNANGTGTDGPGIFQLV